VYVYSIVKYNSANVKYNLKQVLIANTWVDSAAGRRIVNFMDGSDFVTWKSSCTLSHLSTVSFQTTTFPT